MAAVVVDSAGGPYAGRMDLLLRLLEDPGRFHWKWIAIAAALLAVYGIERAIRTGGLF